ncbi:tellurite resistance TerB family protein [Lutibaculum baratangense]|uniref:Putative membrane protein n=1 Tax=Lutibaculum baratangense AMV1 TaxID=631454 RepID=V4RLP7_9HYPH|nr:tellurite resistance TerB family protein [Lutibaculum baratangense]ESR26244.1 putative membrane protein [Lutibaculum baratangense AMV1]
MLDTKAILGQLLNQKSGQVPAKSGAAGDVMAQVQSMLGGARIPGGAATAGLAAMLLGTKGGRKLGKSVIKWGGLALLGGMAYKAYANWQAGNQPGSAGSTVPEQPPAHSKFAAVDPAVQEAQSKLMIRAMIAAARSDGRIDPQETARLEEVLGHADLGEEGRSFLIEALGQADDVEALAREASTPELAAETWLAARLAIDPDTPQEKAFLARLSSALKLEPDLVAHLEATAVSARDR